MDLLLKSQQLVLLGLDVVPKQGDLFVVPRLEGLNLGCQLGLNVILLAILDFHPDVIPEHPGGDASKDDDDGHEATNDLMGYPEALYLGFVLRNDKD